MIWNGRERALAGLAPMVSVTGGVALTSVQTYSPPVGTAKSTKDSAGAASRAIKPSPQNRNVMVKLRRNRNVRNGSTAAIGSPAETGHSIFAPAGGLLGRPRWVDSGPIPHLRSGGGGPDAERSEERLVEGASRKLRGWIAGLALCVGLAPSTTRSAAGYASLGPWFPSPASQGR